MDVMMRFLAPNYQVSVAIRDSRSPLYILFGRFIFTKMDFENSQQSKPFTVFVEGNVGSGKTTFLKHFNKYEAMILSEPVDTWRNVRGHNLLELMYQNPSKWGLAFQTIVQKTMLDLHLRKTNKPLKMMERSIYSARYCFVENLHHNKILPSPDYAVLDEWFKWITTNMDIKGDLIVYLRTDPKVVYERVKARARSEEAQIPLEYLQQLHEIHENWLLNKTAFTCPVPVIVVDANKDLTGMVEEYQKCKTAMSDQGSVLKLKEVSSPAKPLQQQGIPQSPTKILY